MARIHIYLVSDQPIPNMIPIKIDELKPDKIFLTPAVNNVLELFFMLPSSLHKILSKTHRVISS